MATMPQPNLTIHNASSPVAHRRTDGQSAQGLRRRRSALTTLRSQPPRVSVIIPHYNDLENLKRCINLLGGETLPEDDFEVIVADNNSRCGMEEVKRACGNRARVVPAPIQGAGAARNVAVAESQGTILAFIDSDCRPEPDWLERGVAALAQAEIVGGRVDIEYLDPRHPTGVECFEKVFAFNFRRYIEQLGFSGTGNMFVPRSIFDRVGEFRDRVAEDFDWGQRAVVAGFTFHYASDAAVSHPARRDWNELTQKWRRATREAFEAAVEKPGGRSRWFLRSFAVLASPLMHWIRIVRSSKLNSPEERIKAIGVLFRIRVWRFLECNRLLLTETSRHRPE
jgi:glycosyltransferase involved in cell wall biosynthesis